MVFLIKKYFFQVRNKFFDYKFNNVKIQKIKKSVNDKNS
jgi:hypothetical protein